MLFRGITAGFLTFSLHTENAKLGHDNTAGKCGNHCAKGLKGLLYISKMYQNVAPLPPQKGAHF
jgi:hypothetical protein